MDRGRASAPPLPKRVPTPLTMHGETRIDDYFWLRERTHPDVLAQLAAENAYTAAVTAPTLPLQTALYDEMLSHIRQTDLSAPYRQHGFWYYRRTQAGSQYAISCRRSGEPGAPEEVVLDLNELAQGKPFLALGDFVVSDDGNLLAYSLDETGYRQYTLFVKDLRTGRVFDERIERVDGVVWASDNQTLLYVTEDPVTKRADRAWLHQLGWAQSLPVFEETDELFTLEVARTREGSHVFLTSTAKDTTEVRCLFAERPDEPPRLFRERRDGIRYFLDARADVLWIRTNDGAPDFRLFTTPVATPERAAWTEIVAQRPGVTLTGLELFADFAVIAGRRDGLSSLDLLVGDSTKLTPLAFDEPDYAVGPGQNAEFATQTFRFTYQSLVTPPAVFDLDIASGRRTLVKQTDVPGYDAAAYVSERFFATAEDGTRVPVSIVRRRDVPLDGTAALLLYAYGSYGIALDPTFSAARLALLDRGVIFAVAHVRGGGEYGEAWRLAGNLGRKRTTFTDFIDCARALIAARYTSARRLAIQGGSAGGLLVGAVINLQPDLFAAAIAAVPFVDVLTTMLDASLPLTTNEYREWGDPREPGAYAYMRSYSPVDNVTAQRYPALLVNVAYNDSQVPYWEGVKFAARVRTLTTSATPVLVNVNMGAGHGGASGRYDALRERAFDYAFILTSLGIPS